MAFQQMRHGIRSLARVPSLTAVSIATVALGVGAGTSLFSVVKAVLLNPLPYPDADRLVWLAEMNEAGRPMQVALDNFDDWQRQNRSFSSMAAFAYGPANASSDVPQRTVLAAVTSGFFETMRVRPAMGRAFLASEERFGGAMAVVVGHEFWQRAYGGDPKIVGRSIRMSGVEGVIVGVMPAGFRYPEQAEIWAPVTAFGDFSGRTGHNFRVVGRLKPAVTLEQSQTDLSAIARRLKQEYPSPYMAKDAILTPLRVHTAGKVRTPLLVLFAAVGFLLLIVCVNVANLLLVRVTARSRELAIRMALGAGRMHLVRQTVAEAMLLALAGGTLGILMALWSMDLLKVLLPPDVPRAAEISVDWGVLAFALAISGACGLLFGMLPAWRATRMNVNEAVKAGSRTLTAGRGTRLLQSALVISEVCLSLMLLAGAGLLANSFARLRAVQPGFHTDHVLVSELYFAFPKNEPERARLIAKYTDLLARVRAIPGVQNAGTGTGLPLDGAPDGMFQMERGAPAERTDADYVVISPGYLTALRIPLVAGRDFVDADTRSSAGVAIVSSEMARRFWPGRSPLGERIWFNSFEPPDQRRQGPHWLTIVGVAGDVRENGLTQPITPLAYVCYTQAEKLAEASLAIRTPLDPASLSGGVRAALRGVDPEATVSFTTMERKFAESVAQQRFQMQVLGGFAALALLLAAVGLYGVLTYMVAASRVEIGIRMALGAPPTAVFRMVALRALGLAAGGAALGLAGYLALRKTMASLLFGVAPGDPATLAAATVVLLAVALAAACWPALGAMRLDPISALREE